MASSTSALLKALREASTDSAVSSAMEQAVDRLISTPSLSEAQKLVFGLRQSAKDHHSTALTESLYGKLQQAAAICTESPSKAQYLGYVLMEESVHILDTLQVSTQPHVLLKCFNANNGVLSGYMAALTAADGPFYSPTRDWGIAKRTLHMIAPVFKTVLMGNTHTLGEHKAAVMDALSHITWHFDADLEESEDHEAVRTSVANILVDALELVPHSQLAQSAYVAHVAMVVDLLIALTPHCKERVALAKRTARFVLESTLTLIGKEVGVIALLQSLEQLAQEVPEAFWCSVFLASTAYFFVDKCETPLEQRLVLQMLTHTVKFGRDVVSRRVDGRDVYAEILLLPLASMISLHGRIVSELLKLLMEITSMSKFHPQVDVGTKSPPTETATHARSAVQLLSDPEVCRRWLDSLFSSEDVAFSNVSNSTDKWLALILVALLSDGRPSLQGFAAKCFERQVNRSPKFWSADSAKSLVASLVFLVSQHANAASARHFGEWMTSCLYSLAALAATTSETMRIVLRLIDSMNGTTKMRPMALKLMYEVWKNESRVFPRLEAMLLETTSPDDNAERHIVKMATIKMLCEKDPELGVQFISSIQGFLEDDFESVVSMAMDAITSLCGGDCLDFYVAFKIISQKMRKNKVSCAGEPLFQELLCYFYALGGAESSANEKNASKLLGQTWEMADSEHAQVRKAAYAAFSEFPLDLLGLSMPVGDNVDRDSDDKDQVTEDEVEEQIDDLIQRLQNELNADVRFEIEKLMTRVIDHESAKLTVGVGRGQRMASAASGDRRQQQHASEQTGSVMVLSAAATKEMKALLPSRDEVLALFTASSTVNDWGGFLLAYQPKTTIDTKNVKRKDKLVRLATQNVDEMVETITTMLQSMELPWVSASGSNCKVFLPVQTLMEGWKTFMSTYIASLAELAELKTPVGVDDADVGFRVFSEGVASVLNSLLHNIPNKLGGSVAAGALLGQLCETRHWQNPQLRLKYEETVEELSRRLALSIEQARVFSGNDEDARSSSIGSSIAIQLSFGRRKIDASDECSDFLLQLEKIEQMFMELYRNASDELLRSSTLLGLSHIGSLYTNGEKLETFEVTQWRQQRVKPIAELVFSAFQFANHAERQNKSSSNGDLVFPTNKSTEPWDSIDKISADFDLPGSGDDILMRWTSLVGLARLASGFSRIKRLDWLSNVRRVLEAVWETVDNSSIVAVGLGPVLLECVRFNLAHSSSLENFVAGCIQRAVDPGASLDSGFVVLSAAYVLCRLESFGGFVSTTQNQTNLVVEIIRVVLENGSTDAGTVGQLMLSGVANFFHLAFGISGPSRLSSDDKVELTLDPSNVDMLVKLLRADSRKKSDISRAVLGAIASTADGFYISQKKKSFDVELLALPSKNLLAKTLEWLQQANPSKKTSPPAKTIPEAHIATSLMTCLTSTGSGLPLLDYASLTQRVMLRFCSAETTIACVRFAATQGSCDDLLTGKLLSSRWLGNVDVAVQTELIGTLSRVATRVPTDILQALLITIFAILKDIWRSEALSSSSARLFDSWTSMLCAILDTTVTHRISESSREMVNQLVLEKFVVELPFGPDASHFVEQFAVRVLSKLNYGDHAPADTFLMPSGSNYSIWSWWKNGVFVIELAQLNAITITKREASLLFQWVLRHEFDEWTGDKLVNMYLQPLVARVGALIAQHTRPGDNVSSLLDVMDAFSRGMSSLDSSARSDEFKRRALFDLVACVLSWNSSVSHEKFTAILARSENADSDFATDLLPFGLITCAQSSKSASALGERLLILLQQLARLDAAEVARYLTALEMCSRQMYIAADNLHIPSTMTGEIREFWSISNTD